MGGGRDGSAIKWHATLQKTGVWLPALMLGSSQLPVISSSRIVQHFGCCVRM